MKFPLRGVWTVFSYVPLTVVSIASNCDREYNPYQNDHQSGLYLVLRTVVKPFNCLSTIPFFRAVSKLDEFDAIRIVYDATVNDTFTSLSYHVYLDPNKYTFKKITLGVSKVPIILR